MSEGSLPFDDFERRVRAPGFDTDSDETLRVDLEGFEGPLDLLLSMARDQKIDLRHISILALADQYLSYIARIRDMRLEIAADYLVMAAWLAYIKSRLLLPQPQDDEDVSGAEMAAVLTLRLRRYEAMKNVARLLMKRPQLGQDVFKRGDPMHLHIHISTIYTVTLYDLLRAYGQRRAVSVDDSVLRVVPTRLCSMDDALKMLDVLLAEGDDWFDLRVLLTPDMDDPLIRRSVLSAGLAASLELARNGSVDIRQECSFGPIYLREACSQSSSGESS